MRTCAIGFGIIIQFKIIMSLKKTFENKLYKNWVKSGLALKYLKEGLAPFVNDKIQKQHTSFLGGSTDTCDICDLELLLPPHASAVGKTCSKLRERCLCIGSKHKNRFHCPNEVCGKMYDQIIDHHRYNDPSWFNSDVHKWSHDAWEVAKCYINTKGYADSISADDVDCNGLLSIIVNNMMLSAMNDPLFQKCNKVRISRNTIMHSPKFEVTDADLQAHFVDIVDILEDPEELQHDEHAKIAKQKVKELQENEIVITMTDEIELRKEAINAIKQKQDDLEEKHAEVIKQIKSMERSYTDRMGNFESSQQTTETKLKSMQSDLAHYSDSIHDATDKISDLQDTVSQYTVGQSQLLSTVNELKSQVKSLQQESAARDEENKKQRNISTLQNKITSLVEDDLKTVETSRIQANEELCYLQKKQDLQKEMITIYEHHISNLQVSPFIGDLDTNIDDVFVDLVLCDDLLHKKIDEGVRRTDNAVTVDLYRDIFYKESKLCNNIYMLGMGKTTWCMKFLRTWISALKKLTQSEANILKRNIDLDEDEKCALQFDIVAFVPLRHASDDCFLLDMIKNQLFAEKPDMNSAFLEILKTEPFKCLIVLDGLDEWSKPTNTKFSFSQNQNIPGRKDIHGCPVLTTSRPWKIYSVGLKESDTDRAVKIQGIKDRDLMAEKMINKLNNVLHDAEPKHYADFDKSLKDFQRLTQIASLPFDDKLPLSDFMNVPLILVIMVCLWFESGKIYNSYAGNYWAMIGYLIKYAEAQREIKSRGEGIKYSPVLKSCPASVRCLVLKYLPLITKLSKFAFDSVLKPGRNNYLVFDENALKKVLSIEEVQTTVKIGFLSQSKAMGQVLSRLTSLSFLHKSLQEFFAALHIVLCTKNKNKSAIDKFANYCSNAVRMSEMENIVMFVCGLDPETASKMSEHISNLDVSEIRGNEYDKMYMYITYNLPLKCAMQVHACDEKYPSKEFPIHVQHLYVENTEQYKPILGFTYSLLKANIDSIKTISVNTGLVDITHAGDTTDEFHYLKQSPLAQRQTKPLILQGTRMPSYESPKGLTDCTLYGLDLSNFLENDLQKIEKSIKTLRNLKILNIGKLSGFRLLQLDLSKCDVTYFSLKETNHTTIKLNFSKLEEALIENGNNCTAELCGNTLHTCMHLARSKKLRIVFRTMAHSHMTIQFSCFISDKLVVENCIGSTIQLARKNECCHQSVQMNKFVFDKNRDCTLKAEMDLIIDDVSIYFEKEITIDIPLENIVGHVKTISVHVPLLEAFIFRSSRIESLELKLFENERKNLDIVKDNAGKFDMIRVLNIQAQSFDPSHVLNEKLISSMRMLNNFDLKVSEENFSRNTWKSLFPVFERKLSPWRIHIQDFENRSVEWTKDGGGQAHLKCTQLLSKDLKSVLGIINSPYFEPEKLESVKIQANTFDTAVLHAVHKMKLLKEMQIEFTENMTKATTKHVILTASKRKMCKTFSCQNVLESEVKPLVDLLLSHSLMKTIDAFKTFSMKGEEMHASIYESVWKVTKIDNLAFSYMRDCSPETTEEKMVDYLMRVDRPPHSSFCVQVGKDHEKELKIHGNSLHCCNFSVGILTKIVSFAARPSRYERFLTILEVKSKKVDSQCFTPVAQLQQLQTLRLTVTQKVFRDQILEKLFSTLKRLRKLIDVYVSDGSVRCTFSAENISLLFRRGNSYQATFEECFLPGNKKEKSADRVKKIEIICNHVPMKEFRCLSSFAASLDAFDNNQVVSVKFKTNHAEKRFASVGSIKRLVEIIERLSEENFVQGNWL